MRVVVLGAGGVGSSAAAVAARRPFFERMVLADVDRSRADHAVAGLGDRFAAAQVDATSVEQIVALLVSERADAILNACDPRFNPPILDAARQAGVTYLDMAMTLSRPGVLLGSEQLDQDEAWREAGLLCLAGIGVEPGLSDVFARYAADNLFS